MAGIEKEIAVLCLPENGNGIRHHRPQAGPHLGFLLIERAGEQIMSGLEYPSEIAWPMRAVETGFDRTHRPRDFAGIFKAAHDLFPGAFDQKKAEMWAGLRPMMPNSVPVFGQAKYRNLFLDTGHGHLGWTMACGSGKFVSDLVAGRKPDIDPAGLIYRN